MVQPGGKVMFTTDPEVHEVVADGNAFKADLFGAGDAQTITAPAKPGSYPFMCAIHR